MKKTIYTILIPISILLLAGCKKEQALDASGTFEATEIVVSSEGVGKLLQFDVEEGMKLESKKLVGRIDSMQLALEKDKLEAEIKVNRSMLPDIPVQLAPLQENLAKEQFEKTRTKNLIKADSANQKQLDDINSRIEYFSKKIAATKSDLENLTSKISETNNVLNAQIKILDDKIAKCEIINPIDGLVLVKYAEPNEIASFGRPLYKIANLDNMFLRAYLTDAQLNKIKLGDSIKIRADFGVDGYKYYTGVITWISDKAEFTPKGIRNKEERADLVYAVKLSVKNDGFLKIGQYAEVELK